MLFWCYEQSAMLQFERNVKEGNEDWSRQAYGSVSTKKRKCNKTSFSIAWGIFDFIKVCFGQPICDETRILIASMKIWVDLIELRSILNQLIYTVFSTALH